MRALAEGLTSYGEHRLYDLPGFGRAPVPDEVWGSEDYADYIYQILASEEGLLARPLVIVGHSFGGRVALQFAAKYDKLNAVYILLASHGLKRQRSPMFRIKAYGLSRLGSLAKWLDAIGPFGFREKYVTHFGSTDYRNAGAMRPIMVRAVSEDLSCVAAKITAPVFIAYGADDTQTPPEFGERFHKLLQDSQLHIFPHMTHDSILQTGRHAVLHKMKPFLDKHILA